jgi:hypothetical protein
MAPTSWPGRAAGTLPERCRIPVSPRGETNKAQAWSSHSLQSGFDSIRILKQFDYRQMTFALMRCSPSCCGRGAPGVGAAVAYPLPGGLRHAGWTGHGTYLYNCGDL